MAYEKTNTKVEWDINNKTVLAHKFRDGEPQATGIERQENTRTAWYPVVNDFPSDYIPGQPRLLGDSRYHLDEDEEVVVATYPDADFSPQAFRDNAKALAQQQGFRALSESDWYVIRWVEKSAPIPPEVSQAREAVRQAVDSEIERIDNVTVAELQDYSAVEVNNKAKELRDSVDERRHGNRPRPGSVGHA